jgi:hypothetical protein
MYTNNMKISQNFVKWELEDENGKDIVCIEVPAQIE